MIPLLVGLPRTRSFLKYLLFWSLVMLSFIASVFAAEPEPDPTATADPFVLSTQQTQGVVFIVDGVGGIGRFSRAMEEAIDACEVPYQPRHHYWSHGFGRWHADLTDEENVARYSEALADSITGYRVRHPSHPVFIVARSGGTAIALEALKQLPADSVDRVVLLSSGLSPDYDLTDPMKAVRKEMVNYYSERDTFVLGVGTRMFGTVDRVRTRAAGLVGFRVADDAPYHDKFRQMTWDAEMARTWNLGTHLGSSAGSFLRHYIVPLLDAQHADCQPEE